MVGSGPTANRGLALDAAVREAWHGSSDDEFDRIVELGPQETSILVGGERAALVGGDRGVRDDSWIGPHSVPLLAAQPGPMPAVHGLPRGVDPGLLLASAHTTYKLKVRWYSELDDDNCTARWLLVPVQAKG
ncbi:hypothetical protein [Actinomadura bangladeshensis]|uniref:hypothetical protein n=1 Tax=Actinomadura bangladeshensis TaxID=453573 RepID=UPI001942F87E|nr:hypothetical protein [Actinomadura bangladeshensis]